jgi:hypothetical protein
MRTTTVLTQAWGSSPAKVTLDPGTYRVIVYDEDTNDYAVAKDHVAASAETFHADYQARVDRTPEVGIKGNILHIIDGPLAGRFLRPRQVTITPPGPAGQAASISAAERRGYERAIAEFRQPVAFPDDLYRRVLPE